MRFQKFGLGRILRFMLVFSRFTSNGRNEFPSRLDSSLFLFFFSSLGSKALACPDRYSVNVWKLRAAYSRVGADSAWRDVVAMCARICMRI